MPEEPDRGDVPTAETSARTPESAVTLTGSGAEPAGDGLPLSPGQVLAERYWIQKLLGRGGMGEVWHALDLKLRVDVALKSLHPKFFADDRRREFLRQEVRTAREVISPNVCRVYDLLELDGRELLSMEHIDGETLLSLLKERAPLPLSEARDLALQFLTGLDAVHEAGLVHRDFKPENVMITRSGRVVVMDFGIAQKTEEGDGSVAGTPAYMAPEQSRGETVDGRTDLFAVGVVLAEMVSEAGVRDHTSRKSVWEAVRMDPPRIPESPWSPVIRKAVAPDPNQRPDSAQALIRSLQEITLRVEGAEEQHPYPGLASFTEEDAEHFFGREPEVEAMARRLGRAHLLALAGPSGAGKSSFLRAGLIPSLPEGWTHVYSQPGERALASLGQALAAAVSDGAKEAAAATPESPEDAEAILKVAKRWRQDHAEALVILDQFEELFTLNSREVQAQFAILVGRLATEADVRVLVSMRDDFLFHSQAHEPLTPIFSELMPLGPPAGAALNRALVQPALSLGYRFEDESLVAEMLEEVSRERGALPLLAFAAAGLWERRDPDEGLLTRKAYEAIGGVGGALAQHAEATLEKIGRDREPIVRELFRNLVTAQGTRAVRDRDELLSVFEDKASPEEVLGELIAARLLTSFEVSARESADSTQRVEVIHESLLSAWPRLVRWRTQDAEGAQLRDQLRQASGLWDERGRPEELLWTGASYLEYRAWRERYPGGLTALETAFVEAMVALAGRRRRRRQVVVGSAFAVLLAALVTFGTLWRQAVNEARRAEGSKLHALGQLQLEEYPSAALAYAIASLERHDDPTVRQFVMEVLWRGPTELQITTVKGWQAGFTPDGEWILRQLFDRSRSEVRPRDGGSPLALPPAGTFFSVPDGRLVSFDLKEARLGVWSLPSGELVHSEALDGRPIGWAQDRLYTMPFVDDTAGSSPAERFYGRWRHELRSRPLDGTPPKTHGRFFRAGPAAVDPSGQWLVVRDGATVSALPVDDLETEAPRRLGQVDPNTTGWLRFSADGAYAGMLEGSTGRTHTWSLNDASAPARVFDPARRGARWLSLDRDGSRFLTVGQDQVVRLWDQVGPPDARPVLLQQGEITQVNTASFHPSGDWILTCAPDRLSLWPLARTYPRVLPGHDEKVPHVAFTPDGQYLVTVSSDGRTLRFPLWSRSGERVRELHSTDRDSAFHLAIDPQARYVVTDSNSGPVRVIPLVGGEPRLLEGFQGQVMHVAVGPQGRLVATGGASTNAEERRLIRVWDLESGDVEVMDRGDSERSRRLDFTSDGRLVYVATDGLRIWDLASGSSRLLRAGLSWFVFDPKHEIVYATGTEYDEFVRLDVRTGATRAVPISFAWENVYDMAIDPTETVVATSHDDGSVRVTPLSGGPSHLLLGHRGAVRNVAISPDGRWIATGGQDTTVRLWPMPEGVPFHTLPHDELLARLRALTNLRAVPDDESSTGYTLGADPSEGWVTLPTW